MKLIELSLRILVAIALQIFGVFSPTKARYGKRLMFLTTAHAALVKEGILQEMSLEAFNETFRLADDVTLLDASVIANASWNKVDLKTELSKCLGDHCDLESKDVRLGVIDQFSPKIVERSPLWMRYSTAEMTNDISNIFLVSGFTKKVKEMAV